MGADCKWIMNSLPSLSATEKKDPTKIIQELKKHFIPPRNVLYERFVFNSAVQKPGKTIDEYVVRLRQMAESCEFGTLKDSLIVTSSDVFQLRISTTAICSKHSIYFLVTVLTFAVPPFFLKCPFLVTVVGKQRNHFPDRPPLLRVRMFLRIGSLQTKLKAGLS